MENAPAKFLQVAVPGLRLVTALTPVLPYASFLLQACVDRPAVFLILSDEAGILFLLASPALLLLFLFAGLKVHALQAFSFVIRFQAPAPYVLIPVLFLKI